MMKDAVKSKQNKSKRKLHIIVKLLKNKKKEKIVKSVREKGIYHIQGNKKKKWTLISHEKQWPCPKDNWRMTSKYWEKKICKPKILCSVKTSFKNEDKKKHLFRQTKAKRIYLQQIGIIRNVKKISVIRGKMITET